MPKKIIILISAVVITISLITPFLRQNTNMTEEIVISVANQPAMGLIFIAQEKGFFKENGLNVKFRRHILGRDALKDVFQQKADLATVFDYVVIKNIYEGKKLNILTSLHNSNRYHAVASFKTAGIKSPEDLVGKKIGVTLGVSAEFFLNSLLDSSGIKTSEVTIINLEPGELITSLDKGAVDAAVLFSPYLQQFELDNGSDNVTLLYSDTYTEESLLVARPEFLEQNRSKIVKLLTSLNMAQDYYENNQKDSTVIIDKWLKDYSLEALSEVISGIELSLGLSNTLLTHLERISEYVRSNYTSKQNSIRLREFIKSDYLKQVDSEKVTLY